MNIPLGAAACDAAHQELLPVQSLGSEYVVVRYPPRGGDDSAPVTLVGMVDDTNLTYDPMPAQAPPSLARGQVAVLSTDAPFSVRSQDGDHPFYVAAHMTGGDLAPAQLGDPEYVNLVPPEQYLPRYLFITDPTYRWTALALARVRGESGFADVTIDCAGVVQGWKPVGAADRFEVAHVMLVDKGNKVGSCDNGVHTASSDLPFGLTVWGYDTYASYAYPAGMRLAPINTVVVPAVPK